ncbi:flagellar motor protein MotB [Paenibacillus apiarius]|uniref:Flagellar motor protein MotB n=1 Tax=Paenibacillus apiarius TaxID=46240 RepID=A0ABT4DZV7_9BACL|nr:flagellar motor protein MotB [Paenibacillus apiarius]MBN3524392.1 flagellar motor protein MotB [Paenibacillus apiarius]MCY9516576.1 flagellar motor protein MotB [Paenibacillus apiarius]MCY9522887.1 flagellar motor protein MotB [Paenibacillus apiarius]MCY9555246.1 flagellar motor protein MotB [Paenibacillus apiarius]MCY9560764.1 flagellar motor protein MotB [Paenibacillus apiarius]
MSKKRSQPHEEHADESWLIPYADILTLLLALFIVLYGMSAVDAKKFEQMSQAFSVAFSGGVGVLDETAVIRSDSSRSGEFEPSPSKSRSREQDQYMLQAKHEQEQLEQLQSKLNNYIASNGLSDQLNTKLNHSELKITIKDSALYDSGKASLKKDSKQLALTIGDMLKQYQGYEVVISGHTDNRPIRNSRFESNWDLSSARALSFMKVVLERSGMDPKLFKAVGMGEYHPVADNATEEGKAKNRRVEVSVLRKFTDKQAPGGSNASEADTDTEPPGK